MFGSSNHRFGRARGLWSLLLACTLAQAHGEGPGGAPGSPRQLRLERFRTFQSETRRYKKEQRLARELAARAEADAQERRARLAGLERKHGLPRVHSRTRTSPRQAMNGMFCLTLLGLGSLSDPTILGVLAQGTQQNMAAQIDRFSGEVAAGLGQLRQACGRAPGIPGLSPAPCAAGYGTGLSAQVDGVHAQMVRLFVDPAALGAGQCLAGEPADLAKLRIALDQSDILAEYDGLINDAATLQFQLTGAGFVLDTIGTGLLAGQAGALATAGNMTGLAAITESTLGEVGHSLIGAGFGVKSVGSVYGKISSVAITYKSKYLRWAAGQSPAVLADCSGAPASRGLEPARTVLDESPLAVLETAVRKLTAGCALAGQHGLNLMVCSEESLAEFTARNDRVADLQTGPPCLSSGVLTPGTSRGSQDPCPRASLTDATTQSVTFAYFAQYLGEVSAAAYDALRIANAFVSASEGLAVAGDAALAASVPAGGGLITGQALLVSLGNGLFADGYDLLRLAARSGRWVADLSMAFNAESRAQLDDQERTAARSSSTGATEPAGSSGAAHQAAASRAPGEPADAPSVRTADPDASLAAPDFSVSAAASIRPFTFRDLLGLMLPRLASAPAAHGEL